MTDDLGYATKISTLIDRIDHLERLELADPLSLDTLSVTHLWVNGNVQGYLVSSFFTASGPNLGHNIDDKSLIATFQVGTTNVTSLNIYAYRVAAGSDWQTTAFVFSFDVDYTTWTDKNIVLRSDGRVGIGTHDMHWDGYDYKLSVDGFAHATEWDAPDLWASGDGSGHGMWIGSDGQFYRDGTNTIRTPNVLIVGNEFITTGSMYLWATGASINWGASGSYDVNLYRASANALKTDDHFYAGGDVWAYGNIALATVGAAYYAMGAGGWVKWWYRHSVWGDTYIVTDTSCLIGGDIVAGTSIKIYNASQYLYFGDSAGGYDTNLYRNAANRLKTDDTFIAAELVTAGDTGGIASTTAITNVYVATGGGAGNINYRVGGSAQNQGWLKIYIGTNAYYVPYWA